MDKKQKMPRLCLIIIGFLFSADIITNHVQVPSFGEWGFNMAFNGEHSRHDLNVDTKYLSTENIDSLFVFGKDESIDLDKIKENSMFEPSLITYYNEEVQNW